MSHIEKSPTSCPSGQTGYHFSIPLMTLVATKAFSSVEEPVLNHAANVNLIGVFVLSVNATNIKELQTGIMPLSTASPFGSLTPAQFTSYR